MNSKSTNLIYCCPACGGDLIGDGHTMVVHCENADLPLDIEPDADPIFCDPENFEFLNNLKLVKLTFSVPSQLLDEIKSMQEKLHSEGTPGCEDLDIFALNLLELGVTVQKLISDHEEKGLPS